MPVPTVNFALLIDPRNDAELSMYIADFPALKAFVAPALSIPGL